MPANIGGKCLFEDLSKLSDRGKLVSLFNFENRIISLCDGTQYNIDRISMVDIKDRYKGHRLLEAAKRLSVCNQGSIFVDLEDARDVSIAGYGVNGNCIQYNRNVRDVYAALFPLESYIVPSANGLGHMNTVDVEDSLEFEEKNSIVFWRGAVSGSRWETLRGRTSVQMLDLFNNSSSYSRINAVKQYASSDWADIKFSSGNLDNIDCKLRPYFTGKVSVKDQLENKYILVLKGNDVGSSLYWTIFSNSLVIKEETSYETIADYFLCPWRDYVPCDAGASDLEAKFLFLESELNLCLKIVTSAKSTYSAMLDKEMWNSSLLSMYTCLGILR